MRKVVLSFKAAQKLEKLLDYLQNQSPNKTNHLFSYRFT